MVLSGPPPARASSQGGPALPNTRRRLLDPNKKLLGSNTPQSSAAETLQTFFDAYHGKDDVDDSELEGQRAALLKALWNNKTPHSKPAKTAVDNLHMNLAKKFNDDERAEADPGSGSDDHGNKGYSPRDVCTILKETTNIHQLLARGNDQSTILHTILDPTTYAPRKLRFGRLKPLVQLLLWLQPELTAMKGGAGDATPLFFVLKSGAAKPDDDDVDSQMEDMGAGGHGEEHVCFDDGAKAEIIRFICKQNTQAKGACNPITSLTLPASLSNNDGSPERNAIHAAIESNVLIPEDIVTRLRNIRIPIKAEDSDKEEERPCLEMPDRLGRSCLHIALTAPFTKAKLAWAEMLAKVQPGLLKATYEHSRTGEYRVDGDGKPIKVPMTPLQYLIDQRKLTKITGHKDKTIKANWPDNADESGQGDLDAMEDFLKSQEIFLTLDDETISCEFLKSLQRHYSLDTFLKSVHISNNNRIRWSDKDEWDEKTHTIARSWHCQGNKNLFMVFHWLRDVIGVKKVFEVVVDDFQAPHSDRAIVECLKNLGVQTWDWRRMDIPVNVIQEAAGAHVKSLNLYCSGLRAVLQSWSDTRGLVTLEHLERVEVDVHQGLESKESVKAAAKSFKEDMEKIHGERYEDKIKSGEKKKLEVICTPIIAVKKTTVNSDTASKVKADGESGFEEQDWLKCMDEFAGLVENIEPGLRSQSPHARPIKVALIDDGVKTSYAWLDENVHCGRSWSGASATSKGGDKKRTTKHYPRNYNSSETGHGTVMAYYIRRVCPGVQLCIAKLDCQSRPKNSAAGSGTSQQLTFSIESATEAIKWAVSEKVDIISMSWAIDKPPARDNLSVKEQKSHDKRKEQLRDAISLAADSGILLFCANPDKGTDYARNETYPKALVAESMLFCIGAATQEGKRWNKISSSDDSCDFFLPGVELGIPVEATPSRRGQDDPPPEWRKNSGSSLSCALAAGLAAMVLHCTMLHGVMPDDRDPRWKWLKTREGMSAALRNISVEQRDQKGLWLPVRRVFGEAVKYLDASTVQMIASFQNDVVDKLLNGAPRAPRDPAPGALKRVNTSTRW